MIKIKKTTIQKNPKTQQFLTWSLKPKVSFLCRSLGPASVLNYLIQLDNATSEPYF